MRCPRTTTTTKVVNDMEEMIIKISEWQDELDLSERPLMWTIEGRVGADMAARHLRQAARYLAEAIDAETQYAKKRAGVA